MTFLDWYDRWSQDIRLAVLGGDPPVQHIVRVAYTHPSFVGERPLAFEAGTLTLDMGAVGFAEATLSVKVPTAGEDLGALDPRTGARIIIRAGYKLPGRAEEVHPVADLALRERVARYPQNLLELRATSDDATLAGSVLLSGAFSTAGVREALEHIISAGLPGSQTILSDIPAAYLPDQLPTVLPAAVGDPLWPLAQSIADLGGVVMFCDSLRVWHLYLTDRADVGGNTWYTLTTGAPDVIGDSSLGGVISAESVRSLEQGYANVAMIRRRLPDGTSAVSTAAAGSPVHWGTVGMTALVDDRRSRADDIFYDWPAATREVLRRATRRGAFVTVEAMAAWWVSAWCPILVRLPGETGDATRYSVERVTFDLGAGVMHVRAALSSFAPIIT